LNRESSQDVRRRTVKSRAIFETPYDRRPATKIYTFTRHLPTAFPIKLRYVRFLCAPTPTPSTTIVSSFLHFTLTHIPSFSSLVVCTNNYLYILTGNKTNPRPLQFTLRVRCPALSSPHQHAQTPTRELTQSSETGRLTVATTQRLICRQQRL
jgi:hypothetical protein